MNRDSHFKASPSAETQFARALRQVARAAGSIVNAHVDGHKIANEKAMQKALNEYAELIGPWATRQSAKMLETVSKKNSKAYKQKSKIVGAELSAGIARNNVGESALLLLNEQVALIKSIPVRAGLRAQKLAFEAVMNGTRADEIAKELQRTTSVSESDAVRIARTETAKANASLTQARAVAVGATHYIWRTTMDGAERPSHRAMNGKVIDYSKPPTLNDGTTGHAGNFPNCRCYQEPIFE